MAPTLPDACDRTGVKVETARGWLRKGRQGVADYVAFAEAVDCAAAARRLPAADGVRAMTREELEQLVAAKARAGSVPAMRLWLDLHRAEAAKTERVRSVRSLR